MIKTLTSSQNPEVKWVRNLKKDRTSHVLVEGQKLLLQAKQSGWELEQIWFCNEVSQVTASADAIQRIVPHRVYEKLSPTKTNKGPLGIFRRPVPDRPLFRQKEGRYLLLDSIQDPGNAGALIRAAAAFGLDGIIWFGTSLDLYHHAVIRSSAGTVFGLNHYTGDHQGLEGGPVLMGTSAGGCHSLPEFQWPSSFVLCLGNEGHGLGDWLLDRCETMLSIPINQHVESLNVAGAAHVLLYAYATRNK